MWRSARRQQLMAMHHRKSFSYNKKRLQSQMSEARNSSGGADRPDWMAQNETLMDYPVDKGGRLLLHNPLRFGNVKGHDVVKSKADVKAMKKRIRGKRGVRLGFLKKKTSHTLGIEHARDAGEDADVGMVGTQGKKSWMQKHIEKVKELVFEEVENREADSFADKFTDSVSVSGCKYEQYKDTRFKFFLTRRAIEKEPTLLTEKLDELRLDDSIDRGVKKSKKAEDSPGAYTLHMQQFMEEKKLSERKDKMLRDATDLEKIRMNESTFSIRKIPGVEKKDARDLMVESRHDEMLSQRLLYDVRYDRKWKSRYTEPMVVEDGLRKKKPLNSAGWVMPLKHLCDKIGYDSSFFTDNPNVRLPEARAFILHQRFTLALVPSEFLSVSVKNVRNPAITEFFRTDWDGRSVLRRMAYYNNCIENDRDRVRVHGQYYNNIYLGKRMFGPGRKQMFVRTMVGGMERRFEILDNQVNHIAFTHEASDRNPDKCRNPRIKCRDSTRVVLSYPFHETENFIHANYVRNGPMFNQFIITQAPMENTIGDFWRMVWQEEAPYIFMLISRKDLSRCAKYWPRAKGEKMFYYGLEIRNVGIDEFRSPLFRVTQLCVIGPRRQELRVEHWQGDFNNSDNLAAPLQLLQLARNCERPCVVHCHLGVSRSPVLVAIEVCIASILKGPSYKHLVQKAVHLVRSQRAFSVETPMQYIYIHRVLQHFLRPFVSEPHGLRSEYKRWIGERSLRSFVDDVSQPIPGHRLLSPRTDPDLIVLARHRERPDYRRETHDCVGQLPIPLEDAATAKRVDTLRLPKKYPRGNRYP